jgi:hypothetical protein
MSEYTITRIKNDVNGNSRRVIHFLAFITPEERGTLTLVDLYEFALKKARKLGGRKFHNKQYGGGIVFQAYSDDEVYELVARANATNATNAQ